MEAPAGLVETWLHHVGRTLSDQEIEDISPPFVAAKGPLGYRKTMDKGMHPETAPDQE